METITVRVRPTGTDYEDVVMSEIDWEKDVACVDQATKTVINQSTMKKEKVIDEEQCRALRICACITKSKTPFVPGMIRKMPRKDVQVMLNAYVKLNLVDEDEKSSPLETDSGSARSEGLVPEPESRAVEEQEGTPGARNA